MNIISVTFSPVLGIDLWASHMQGRHSTHPPPPSHIVLVPHENFARRGPVLRHNGSLGIFKRQNSRIQVPWPQGEQSTHSINVLFQTTWEKKVKSSVLRNMNRAQQIFLGVAGGEQSCSTPTHTHLGTQNSLFGGQGWRAAILHTVESLMASFAPPIRCQEQTPGCENGKCL